MIELNSRSVMRRMAAQKPSVLIEEIEVLRAELDLRKDYAEKVREQSKEIQRLKAELDTVSGMYEGMRRRLRERKDQLKESGRWSSHD